MIKLSNKIKRSATLALIALMALMPSLSATALASSHMDAPLITRDPAANTTDVYAFVTTRNSAKFLNLALGVYPHENPAVGPNKYNFDETVRYEIHVALGSDVAAGRASVTYRFEFQTKYKTQKTILQSYLGVVNDIDDASQNLTQTYTVTKIDNRGSSATTILGSGKVPPNNQGNATPFYNQGNNGEMPARPGVSSADQLDKYTQQAIATLSGGYVAFAGQRDDGFYADVQSIFDLLKLRNPGKDSQGGYNIHLMALAVPVADIGGDQQAVGVYATTSRMMIPVETERRGGILDIINRRPTWVQVARQGNPLFNEGLVALEDKDTYSRTNPAVDSQLFRKYAESPELAALINALIGGGQQLAIPTGRADIAAIFIPDLIKVDLSTDQVKLAGGTATNPDDTGFSRLGIFGGDVLESRAAGHPFRLPSQFIGLPAGKFYVPGGWPNGRRFGDDVVDIAIIALLSDLRDPANLKINDPFKGNYDGVTSNGPLGYNKVFPYESTPENGRNIIGLPK